VLYILGRDFVCKYFVMRLFEVLISKTSDCVLYKARETHGICYEQLPLQKLLEELANEFVMQT
jgi:hypothetical protein